MMRIIRSECHKDLGQRQTTIAHQFQHIRGGHTQYSSQNTFQAGTALAVLLEVAAPAFASDRSRDGSSAS